MKSDAGISCKSFLLLRRALAGVLAGSCLLLGARQLGGNESGTASLPVVSLPQSLPTVYRAETAAGILLLTPEQLLIRLAGPALAEIDLSAADQALLEEALTLYMVLLHSRALGQIGDRVNGMTPAELCTAVWLTAEELPPETVSSPEEEALLQQAADRAAPYFLSVEGALVREVLPLSELYTALSEGESADLLLQAAYGENVLLEQAEH